MPGALAAWPSGRSKGLGMRSDNLIHDIRHVSPPSLPIHQTELATPTHIVNVSPVKMVARCLTQSGCSTQDGFLARRLYLILFTPPGKPGTLVFCYDTPLTGQEAGAHAGPATSLSGVEDRACVSPDRRRSPRARSASLSTSLLLRLAACHLALSLLISTSTTEQQENPKG